MLNDKCRFAPVAPVDLLQDMLNIRPDICGAYHLLLAHEVLAKPEEFAAWATSMRLAHMGRNVEVIMDSSVIELGLPMTITQILEAADIVNANTIVLPDIIGDQQATHHLVIDAMEYPEVKKYNTMFVPQGENWDEYVESLEFAAKYKVGTCIGLPRDAVKYLNSRYKLALMTRIINKRKPIHLLGFSNTNVWDDFYTAVSVEGIIGIDSAVPVRAGVNNIPFSLSRSDYGPRGDYWDSTEANTQVVSNVTHVRSLLS